jgi:hypothetical protein
MKNVVIHVYKHFNLIFSNNNNNNNKHLYSAQTKTVLGVSLRMHLQRTNSLYNREFTIYGAAG